MSLSNNLHIISLLPFFYPSVAQAQIFQMVPNSGFRWPIHNGTGNKTMDPYAINVPLTGRQLGGIIGGMVAILSVMAFVIIWYFCKARYEPTEFDEIEWRPLPPLSSAESGLSMNGKEVKKGDLVEGIEDRDMRDDGINESSGNGNGMGDEERDINGWSGKKEREAVLEMEEMLKEGDEERRRRMREEERRNSTRSSITVVASRQASGDEKKNV
ncbi:hypothetical protein M231_07307 [Tremella mesenterica]|uniref:Uncharacterized protein n=1 Tax=Tremella mesenterica TaxID=5217 RepID=A0A4Q1B9P7_TREME|nr:hypothetical protein M231_07307 [Tremella mesenterica]